MQTSQANHASDRKRRTSRLLCLTLCLVTWRGPLPCLHAHAAGPQIVERDVELATHCQQFHEDVTDDRELGWHLHVLLPWADEQSAAGDQDAPADPLLKSEVLLVGCSAPALDVEWGQDGWNGVLSVAVDLLAGRVPDDVWIAHSFLNSLMQTVPLCAVTGVALC
ncbi:MAG: hypothetical protein KDA90_06510 [Planctomycetaceae bacterium]|nr:hypothetical protein [Planctomycetaceae bacterium]